MNIHHLELFYYVARHGGFSAAAREIPYGIQQPAISAQVIQLEQALGKPLLIRRPFGLTKEGEQLFAFIAPFFGELGAVSKKIRGQSLELLRIGAPETILADILPNLLSRVRTRHPGFRFNLQSGSLEELEHRLLNASLDLAFAPLHGKRATGIQQRTLLQLPLALMLPNSLKLRDAEALFKKDRLSRPTLISSNRDTLAHFEHELQSRGLEWTPSIELPSQALAPQYVREGFGVAVILRPKGFNAPDGTRLLPLPQFAPLPFGALWSGQLGSAHEFILKEAEALARGGHR